MLSPPPTILVVDDDVALLDALELTLSDLGYFALTTDDPVAALALMAASGPVDLLFADVVMPHAIDGWELARRARRLRPAIKVLYMSGYANRLLPGMGDPALGQVLPKPWASWQLPIYVRRSLGRAENAALRAAGRESTAATARRLRAQSRRWREAAMRLDESALKRRLAERALHLAQSSETASRRGAEADAVPATVD